jgi:hypothetical protein
VIVAGYDRMILSAQQAAANLAVLGLAVAVDQETVLEVG